MKLGLNESVWMVRRFDRSTFYSISRKHGINKGFNCTVCFPISPLKLRLIIDGFHAHRILVTYRRDKIVGLKSCRTTGRIP